MRGITKTARILWFRAILQGIFKYMSTSRKTEASIFYELWLKAMLKGW